MYGDPYSNWLSFFLNTDNGSDSWLPEAHVDSLELMDGKLSHDFAEGIGHMVAFKDINKMSGHVTTWIDENGGQSTDCERGYMTCIKTNNFATKTWDPASSLLIKTGVMKHHFDIDIWASKNATQLVISNIKILAGGDFQSDCPSANPM